ncbi:hypothetical protein [Kineococcus sp. SYSU DK002]|uniref:hypothetical protein n=1 Tax=Kineococcus sp. SYSU DK002 TaxID=3383123 RepID=UPI003D7D87ED
MDDAGPDRTGLDARDRRLVALLRTGCSATEAARRLGEDTAQVAARLVALRTRYGVGSTRALLAALPAPPD